jgi:hypothetical protein
MMPASSSAITAAYKTAWFMAHRIRERMRDLNRKRPLGSRRRAASVGHDFCFSHYSTLGLSPKMS